MKKQFVFIALLVLAATSCNRFYKAPDFEEATKNHKLIAVLPYEIVITGRLPKDLTEENRKKIEEAESVAFQKSLAHMIYTVGGRGKRELTVTIQTPERTAKILAENGIGIRESWNEDPQKMAALLGVDAVIQCKAIKQRYLSDLESIGVQVGTTILQALTGFPLFGPSRTNDVEAYANIINATDGKTLFTGRDEISVDWSRPANEAIETINRRICRRFPYVQK